jgi:uncharacterized protein (TIGR02118 family)
MIKLVYIIRVREDVPVEEAQRYWLESHAPKVRSVAETIGARRYVQSHTIDTPLNQALIESRGMTNLFEGITEVWWDSLETLAAATSTPEGQQALGMLAEDESTFIDMSRSTVFLTEEHEIFNLGDAGAGG